LYQAHYGMVLQLCLGFSEGREDQAKDLTQEVFIRVWRKLDTFREEASAKTWIYRITVNTCLNFLKKQKSRDRKLNEALRVRSDTAETPTDGTDQTEVLYAAMAKLSEIDRLVTGLVLDGVSQEEIAAILGITEGNVRVKIHRIKKRLQKVIHHE
jgi:RNA polymerase sigma-70 factor (ECF subfamily)